MNKNSASSFQMFMYFVITLVFIGTLHDNTSSRITELKAQLTRIEAVAQNIDSVGGQNGDEADRTVAEMVPGQQGFVAIDVFGADEAGAMYILASASVLADVDDMHLACIERMSETGGMQLCNYQVNLLTMPALSGTMVTAGAKEGWLLIDR